MMNSDERKPPSPQLLKPLEALRNPDAPPHERRNAANVLGARTRKPHDIEIVVPLLVKALENDPDWQVRCEAADALGKIGDPSAIPALRAVSRNDDHESVREAAANALRNIEKT